VLIGQRDLRAYRKFDRSLQQCHEIIPCRLLCSRCTWPEPDLEQTSLSSLSYLRASIWKIRASARKNGPVYPGPLPLIFGVRDNVQDAADSGNCFHVILSTDARLRWSDLSAESREAMHGGQSSYSNNEAPAFERWAVFRLRSARGKANLESLKA
jgi:hypothetical protein